MTPSGAKAAHPGSHHPALYWHALADGRIQCDLCPRYCKLHEGQRGASDLCAVDPDLHCGGTEDREEASE